MISYTSTYILMSSWVPSQVRQLSFRQAYRLMFTTGGTDICSLFAGQNTALPVFRGEIQCRMLGMSIDAFSHDGKLVPTGEAGELVCLRPFPCQPIGFWPLPGFGDDIAVEKALKRYKQSYFETFENVWCERRVSSLCH
jgi:acyl-coenzyme A synthetase/AMP-(fatty) acid ligase